MSKDNAKALRLAREIAAVIEWRNRRCMTSIEILSGQQDDRGSVDRIYAALVGMGDLCDDVVDALRVPQHPSDRSRSTRLSPWEIDVFSRPN